MTICQQCGRAFHVVSESLRATAKTLCVWCAFRQPRQSSSPASLDTSHTDGAPLPQTWRWPSTFEERALLKAARFKIATGQFSEWPGEVSVPDRRVPGQAWYEARGVLADFYIELFVPDENEVGGDE